MKKAIVMMVVLLATLCVLPVALADNDPPDPQGKLKGEVVAIRQQVRAQNQGETTEIRVRTQNREEHWLQLGPSEQVSEMVQVGDQVRLRTMAGAAGEPAMVRAMHNYRTGERLRLRDGTGEMIQSQNQVRNQNRHRSSIGSQTQTRQGQGGGQGNGGQQGGGAGGGKGGR